MMNQLAKQLTRPMMNRRTKLARKRKKMYIMYKVYIVYKCITLPYHTISYHTQKKNHRNKLS